MVSGTERAWVRRVIRARATADPAGWRATLSKEHGVRIPEWVTPDMEADRYVHQLAMEGWGRCSLITGAVIAIMTVAFLVWAIGRMMVTLG